MQGMIFTLKRKRRRLPDIRFIIRRYGSVMVFSAALALGVLSGSLVSGSIDSKVLNKLDLLFLTNLPQRLSDGAFGAFCASFGSDFIFLSTSFLLGISLFGVFILPFVAFFKGYGIGLSAGCLLISHGLSGMLFYITVLLPGICLFCLALVYQLRASLDMYRITARYLFKHCSGSYKKELRIYFRKSVIYLAAALVASVLDVILWFSLSGIYKF